MIHCCRSIPPISIVATSRASPLHILLDPEIQFHHQTFGPHSKLSKLSMELHDGHWARQGNPTHFTSSYWQRSQRQPHLVEMHVDRRSTSSTCHGATRHSDGSGTANSCRAWPPWHVTACHHLSMPRMFYSTNYVADLAIPCSLASRTSRSVPRLFLYPTDASCSNGCRPQARHVRSTTLNT